MESTRELEEEDDKSKAGSHRRRASSLPLSAKRPSLPELHVTTTNDSQVWHPMDSSPINPSRCPQDPGDSSDESEDKSVVPSEDEKSAIMNEKENTVQNEADPAVDQDSAETLVEAALDQAEARDRHVRFQSHVAESAALVQRMLSTRLGHTDNATGEPSDSGRNTPSDPTRSSTVNMQPEVGSGSVLASLMKLESQHRRSSTRRSKRKPSTAPKRKKLHKHASLYSLPTVNASADALKPQRPKLTSRSSWLASVTSSNHLVPSLEKRKKDIAMSVSRRSSKDSMLTTASQFEPITLEDRIRITFEIANILQKQEFLRKLAKALMSYGCPAHRLEFIMRQVSCTLGVEVEYVYIPNVMFVTFFDQSTHTTETHFIRQTQIFDMHKLGEVYRLEKLIGHGEVTVDEALEFIDKVAGEPEFYPKWLNPFVYALASFCGCIMFFGGRWKEAGISAALAMFFAVYELFSGRVLSLQPIWEITVCIFIGFVSRAIWRYDFCFTPIAFSSFIIILPGYSMAVAIVELVSRQLVSGIVRMVYAIIYSFLLGYGVEMGSELFGTIDPSSVSQQGQAPACQRAVTAGTCLSTESRWFYFLTVPLFAVAYCIYLRARPPRWPTMIVVSACGFVTNYALSCYANAPPQVLQVVPSFVVGLIGNLLTKATGKMSFDAVLLAVFYLTPGSLGLKAALGLFGGGGEGEYANQGAGFALSMIESSIGITVGLFVSTLIVYPKGTAHTPLMSF